MDMKYQEILLLEPRKKRMEITFIENRLVRAKGRLEDAWAMYHDYRALMNPEFTPSLFVRAKKAGTKAKSSTKAGEPASRVDDNHTDADMAICGFPT